MANYRREVEVRIAPMSNEVTRLLEELGLGEYAQAFVENAISVRALPALTEEDLKELGLKLGHRRILQQAVAALSATPSPAQLEIRGGGPSLISPTAGAERRQLTVMFSDLVGSTELSQQLDPEDLREVNRAYQDACKGAIEQFEGYVARYMGDGVLAYFGYPQAHEDDAERAVRAGLELVQAMERLNAGVGKRNEIELAVRVGIATGLVVVGDLIGEGASQENAVVGETPNLAARLQGLACENNVVIAPATRDLLGGIFTYEDLDKRKLKGIAEPVAAFRVVDASEGKTRFEATHAERLTPLIGREEELEILLRRWNNVKEDEGQVVLISGEPGIGKSRITQEMLECRPRDPYDPYEILRYQCSPYHISSALHPVINQIELASGIRRDDTAERKLEKLEALLSQSLQSLDAVVPLFATLLSIPCDIQYPPLNLSPRQQKDQILAATISQLFGIAAKQPVLLIVEDVHWVDPTTLELLDSIIAQMQDKRVMVLITYRLDFQPRWIGEPHVSTMTLRKLSAKSCTPMIESVTGGKLLPEEVISQIVEKTDGVPLFVEELTKTVLDSGLLRQEIGGYVLDGPLPPLAIPNTLQDSLMARLDRLSSVKGIAQIGSVIGREFDYELIRAVVNLADDELDQALGELMDADLILRRGTSPNAKYIFKHALIQDTAYESLLKSRRQRLHAQIGRSLEQQFSALVETQPEVVAHHYTEAGLPNEAVPFWLKAGGLALSRSANLEAIAHLEKGLEAAGTLSSQEGKSYRIDLLIKMGSALTASKGYASPEVEDVYDQARSLCVESGDEWRLFPVLRGQQSIYMLRGPLSTARHMSQELLRLADSSTSQPRQVEAHRRLGWCLFCLGEMKAGRRHLLQAVELYDPAQAHHHIQDYVSDPNVIALANLAWVEWFLGFPERAVEVSREAIDSARTIRHSFGEAYALCMSAAMHQARRDPAAAHELATATILLATHNGFPYWEAWATIIQGWAEAQRGRVASGLERIERGMLMYRTTGSELFSPYNFALLAETCWIMGRPDEALAHIDAALAEGCKREVSFYDAELHRMRGDVLATLSASGDDVEACYVRAIEIAEQQEACSLELRATTSLCRLWVARGQRMQTRELLSPLLACFTEGLDTTDLREARILIEELS